MQITTVYWQFGWVSLGKCTAQALAVGFGRSGQVTMKYIGSQGLAEWPEVIFHTSSLQHAYGHEGGYNHAYSCTSTGSNQYPSAEVDAIIVT